MFAALLLAAALSATAHGSFDIEDEFQLLEVPNTRLVGAPQCRSASLFAIISSLEIAQQRATGIQIDFSEQEVLDCHHGGCMGASMEDYMNWFAVHDRLAPSHSYTSYRAKAYPCGAAMAPDALTAIKITGIRDIGLEEFEDSILR